MCGVLCSYFHSQNDEHSYLAHSKLGNVFAGFNQIFETFYRSETLQKSLDEKTVDFLRLLLGAKKIELELKALGEHKLDWTMGELCKEGSANNRWLKCTRGNSVNLECLIVTDFV